VERRLLNGFHMVRLALFAALALVPSCYLAEDDDDGYQEPTDQCRFNLCVTPEHPFAFAAVPRFGVGTEVSLTFLAHTSLTNHFEIVSSDPSIELVHETDSLALRAHAAGAFDVIARSTDTGDELARVHVVAADVASIELSLRFAPIETAPLASIALLAGGSDSIGVAFRADTGDELAGSAPVTIDDPTLVQVQAPAWFEVDGPYERMRFGVVGLATGTTRATVSLFDGRMATLPIEVVDAVATADIETVKFLPDGRVVAANNMVALNNFVKAVVVAKTSDGRLVAGVFATWQATGPAELDVATGYANTPDADIVPSAPGMIDVVAVTGVGTLTATIVAK
jgi:hypothetical protein